MKNKKTIIIVCLIVIILGGIGIKIKMNQVKKQQELVEFTKNEKLISDYMRDQDKYKKIKSVDISYDKTDLAPMGSVHVEGTINKNKKFHFEMMLGLDENNKVEVQSCVYSLELTDYIESNK